MNSYDLYMYPLERLILAKVRNQLIPHAHGNVLEIGPGTGVNFAYYDMQRVKSITCVDVNPQALAIKEHPSTPHLLKLQARHSPSLTIILIRWLKLWSFARHPM